MPENSRTKAQEFPRVLILRDHFLNMNGQGHQWLTATFKPASSDGIAKRLEMSFMDSSCFKRMGTYGFKGTFKRSIVLSSFFHLHSNGYYGFTVVSRGRFIPKANHMYDHRWNHDIPT